VNGAKDGNEMILERPDGTFGCVSTVFLRGNTLELDLVLREGVFEILRTFIVENMEIGRMALAQKQLVSGLPSIADAGGLPIRNGNSVNRVSVLVVEDKDIIVTTTGRDVEATSLVRIRLEERLVGKEHDGNLMSAGRKQGSNISVATIRDEIFGRWDRASGTNVLGLLILVAKSSSNRFRKMFAYKLCSKARESDEVTTTNRS
jgi:hypothetical protein